ncbi:MAG: response regulator [Candidatus Acidiferrales bacterium]
MKPQLLIIDDDESVRKVLRFRLKDSYEITDTGSAEEALALALQHKPDAILLDLMMPKYSGFEVCQTLSSLSFTQHIPILIVSGESSARYEDFCENLGAKGFFQKPVDMDALHAKLQKIINGNREKDRPDPRVRLRVMLKLRWIDSKGAQCEVLTVTENVSAMGFLCGCQVAIEPDTVVNAYLARNGTVPVGKAKVARVDWPGTPGQRCDFQFTEKPADWVLR